MFCKQLILPGTQTYHSYPQQTLTALHNTDNIQLCVSDLKARQAVGMTYVALEEIRICAKAQCPRQPQQSVIHTVYTYYSYIYTHTNTKDVLSLHSLCMGLVAARLQSISVSFYILSYMILSVLQTAVSNHCLRSRKATVTLDRGQEAASDQINMTVRERDLMDVKMGEQ